MKKRLLLISLLMYALRLSAQPLEFHNSNRFVLGLSKEKSASVAAGDIDVAMASPT